MKWVDGKHAECKTPVFVLAMHVTITQDPSVMRSNCDTELFLTLESQSFKERF